MVYSALANQSIRSTAEDCAAHVWFTFRDIIHWIEKAITKSRKAVPGPEEGGRRYGVAHLLAVFSPEDEDGYFSQSQQEERMRGTNHMHKDLVLRMSQEDFDKAKVKYGVEPSSNYPHTLERNLTFPIGAATIYPTGDPAALTAPRTDSENLNLTLRNPHLDPAEVPWKCQSGGEPSSLQNRILHTGTDRLEHRSSGTLHDALRDLPESLPSFF